MFSEDYLIEALGDYNIERIAVALYGMNVAWKDARPTGATVGAFIETAR